MPPNPFPTRYARWVFALLVVLDTQLSGSEVSALRDLARAVMRVAGWRWITAVTGGEVTERSGGDGEGGESGWSLGERWKVARDALPTGSRIDADPLDEARVDETLARCWMVVYAIAAGWGQRDLVDELHTLFN